MFILYLFIYLFRIGTSSRSYEYMVEKSKLHLKKNYEKR